MHVLAINVASLQMYQCTEYTISGSDSDPDSEFTWFWIKSHELIGLFDQLIW